MEGQSTRTDQDNPLTFSLNERVIYDSEFGYEIGYFKGPGILYHTYLIDLRSGIIQEPISYSISSIHKYSCELIKELTLRYGYEKSFSGTF
jgi:hypothetical protein